MAARKLGTTTRRASVDARRHLPEPEVGPFILLAWLSVPAGLGSHWLWGRQLPEAAVVTAVMALATAGLFALTAAHAQGREQLQRWQAATSVGLTGINLTQLHVFGAHRIPLGIAGGLCLLTPVVWMIFKSNVVRGWGQDTHDGAGSWTQLVQGTVLGKPKSDGARNEYDGKILDPTITVEDMQKHLPAVLDVATNGPRGGHRIVADPDHSAEFKLVQVTEDVLRHPIPWPGLGRVPRSICDPIPVGRWEDGQEAYVILPGRHLLVAGMTGSGKTTGAENAWVNVLACDDALLHLVDPVKGAQAPKVFRDNVDLFVGDVNAAHAYLAALRRLNKARVKLLGDAGFNKWTREAWTKLGIPHIVVWIEEMAEVVSESDDIVRLTEQLRSGGITLVLSGQRMSTDNIPSSARANFGAAWCFGVKQEVDASFLLSDETMDNGAHPWEWKNFYPGYSYLEARDTPRDHWHTPLRAYLGDPKTYARVIEATAAYRPPRLDGAQAAALGPIYEQTRQETAVTRPDDDSEEPVVLLDKPPMSEPEDEGLDPRAPIQPGPATSWPGDPFDPKDLSHAELVEHFGTLLAELEDERENIGDSGRVVITMEQILPRWPYRSVPWISRALKHYVKAGQLARVDTARFAAAQWEIVALVRPAPAAR